ASDDAQPRLELEALSGLARSIMLENPKHHYKTIQVESTTSENQKAVILFNEWLLGNADKPDSRVRYRGLNRSISALQEIEAALAGAGPAFRQGAVYLITGGLGEIGQSLCEYLARTYHATLIILARSQLSETKQRQLERIEQSGGQGWYYPVDLADRQALRETMTRVKARVDRIDGVIHLARWVEDGLIVDKQFEAFERVMAAKVDGTMHLDEVTRGEPLDFFITFSSLAAYGIKGSADYAYVSAFQNAFAQRREALVRAGKRSGRTRSICWGQWVMDPYSDDERNRLLAQMGFDFLTLETALPALAQSLAQDSVVVGAMAVSDKRKIKALLGMLNGPEDSDTIEALFDRIVLDLKDGRKNKEEIFRRIAQFDLNNFSDHQIEILYAYIPNGSSSPDGSGQDHVNSNGDETRANGEVVSASTDLRTLILAKLKKTLKLENEVINPRKTFQDYGLDSITGMKLAVALQQSLGVEVLPRWLIDYPTVDSLAEKMREIKQQEGQNI
ncbi:MAG TPA: SDR family NAD(P)-dependent oxidoreductase, partial [Anaerolineae bacterium]